MKTYRSSLGESDVKFENTGGHDMNINIKVFGTFFIVSRRVRNEGGNDSTLNNHVRRLTENRGRSPIRGYNNTRPELGKIAPRDTRGAQRRRRVVGTSQRRENTLARRFFTRHTHKNEYDQRKR